MNCLDVLCIGFLVRQGDEILEAHSTSTLIRGEKNIVVDTSTGYMWPAMATSFEQIGIRPEDVDIVILTHGHSDHTGNLDRFSDAEVIIHSGGKAKIAGATVVNSDIEVCSGVRMIHTPGHCAEECSVFVEADRRYAIAGDTIPVEGNFREGKPPAIHTDRRLALDSINRIAAYADVVIPGHGPPFAVRSRCGIIWIECQGEREMFDYGLVDEAIGRIVKTLSPKKIIVFGSVARHDAHDFSDLDILVVMETEMRGVKRGIAVINAIEDLRLPVDVLVLTPEEFEASKDNKLSFASEIVRTGKIVYEV